MSEGNVVIKVSDLDALINDLEEYLIRNLYRQFRRKYI